MHLCLSDAKKSTVSSGLKKAYKKSETAVFQWNWEASHNIEPSQCIKKFTTEDWKYL